MGVNYIQECILGFGVDGDELKQVISSAEYVEEPRYDTKTGEITHTERVLKKEEEFVYKLGSCESYDLWSLGEEVADKFEVDFFVDEDAEWLYLGIKIGDKLDCGRVYLLEGEIDIDTLNSIAATIKQIFPSYRNDVGLNFVSSIG